MNNLLILTGRNQVHMLKLFSPLQVQVSGYNVIQCNQFIITIQTFADTTIIYNQTPGRNVEIIFQIISFHQF